MPRIRAFLAFFLRGFTFSGTNRKRGTSPQVSTTRSPCSLGAVLRLCQPKPHSVRLGGFVTRRRFGICAVTDVSATDPENHILGNVGGVIGYPFQITCDEQRV
jgi:hypothetical protein